MGTAPELVDYFGSLQARGVERVYAWFCDFAAPDTLAAFGEGVISQFDSTQPLTQGVLLPFGGEGLPQQALGNGSRVGPEKERSHSVLPRSPVALDEEDGERTCDGHSRSHDS